MSEEVIEEASFISQLLVEGASGYPHDGQELRKTAPIADGKKGKLSKGISQFYVYLFRFFNVFIVNI